MRHIATTTALGILAFAVWSELAPAHAQQGVTNSPPVAATQPATVAQPATGAQPTTVAQPNTYTYTYNPRTRVYTQQPSYSPQTGRYYYPSSGYVTTQPYRRRGILGRFSRQGGVGTTPYLGNANGLGGYSTSYSAPTTRYVYPGGQVTTYSYPAQPTVYQGQTYGYPVRGGGWFR
jgi:hypothetical protein